METTEKSTEQMEEEVKTALVVIEPESRSVIQVANELVIVDDKSLERSVTVEKELKTEKKKFVDLFKDFKTALSARHKNAVAKEKEMIGPVDKAIDELKEKRNVYVREQEAKRRKEQEEREAEERRIRAQKLDAYNKSIKKAMEKAGGLAEQVNTLKEQLDSPDTPEEAVEGLRSQIRALEAQIENQKRLADEKAAQAEEVSQAPAAPPAPKQEKTEGLVTKTHYTVTVREPRKLCEAIAKGIIGPAVIKGYDTVALQALAKAGLDLTQFGCQVDKEVRTHTRG